MSAEAQQQAAAVAACLHQSEADAAAAAHRAFTHLNIIVFGKVLNVERAGDPQSARDAGRDFLDALDCFTVQLLGREKQGRVAGMHTS